MDKLFVKYIIDDDILEEEESFFKHVILSGMEFFLKVHMNYMARTHYQVKDERLLVGLLPDFKTESLPFAVCNKLPDDVQAKSFLRNTLPFVNTDIDFCEGAYSMILLQTHTHVFKVVRAVYNFISSTKKPWRCRLCLHLFVVTAIAAGLIETIPVSRLRGGPSEAASSWIIQVCGKADISQEWLKPNILTDLPRDKAIFTSTKEEDIVQRRTVKAYTYIPLTRST